MFNKLPFVEISCRIHSIPVSLPLSRKRDSRFHLSPFIVYPKIACQNIPSNKAVVCLSGGLDSTSLLLHLLSQGVEVFGLSFHYGQKHAIELEFLQRNLDYLRQHGHSVSHHGVDLSSLGEIYHSALLNEDWQVPEGHYEQPNMQETVVPNRNAIFASIAYGYAWSLAEKGKSRIRKNASAGVALDAVAQPAVKLCLGVHAGDHAIYPDCRPDFYSALWTAFQKGNWDAGQVELHLPYLNFDKASILRDAQVAIKKLGLDFNTVFSNTLTSYLPDATGRSSGLTGSDVERILAFAELGLQDPIDYHMSWDLVLKSANQQRATFTATKAAAAK